MTYELSPRPVLPDVQQRILGFEQYASPGLIVSSFVEGNLAATVSDRTLSDQPTMDELAAFTPEPQLVEYPRPVIQTSVINNVLEFWRWDYAREAERSLSNIPNWHAGSAVWSPFTTSEQATLVRYTEEYLRRNTKAADGIAEAFPQYNQRREALDYFHAMLLGAVSDIAAIPRIMAGMDFDRERRARIVWAEENYGVSERGAINLPPDDTQPPVQHWMHAIPWRKPCVDVVPTESIFGTMNAPLMRQPLRQMFRILGIVVDINQERLLKPLQETDPSEFRSPFRANSYETLERALAVYSDDRKRILDLFFDGEKIEISHGDRVSSLVLPKRARRPLPLFRPTFVQVGKAEGEEVAPIVINEELLAFHEATMQNLREKELGQRMIDLVVDPRRPLELMRSGRLDTVKLSPYLHARLQNIARILYDLLPDSSQLPPKIVFDEDSKAHIDAIMGDHPAHLQALYLVIDPENKSKGPSKALQFLRVAAILEKERIGRERNLFLGKFFNVLVDLNVEDGARIVTIKGGRKIAAENAKKLMNPPLRYRAPGS